MLVSTPPNTAGPRISKAPIMHIMSNSGRVAPGRSSRPERCSTTISIMISERPDEQATAAASRRQSIVGPLLAAVALAGFGALFLYGGIQIWVGVHQAVAGPRLPGVVRDINCPGGHSACGGTFTSDDATVRARHVVVEGVTTSQASARATFVPKVDTGAVVDSIQSDDTAYVGGVTLSVVGISVIGVILTGLGLVLCLPLLFVLLAVLGGRPLRTTRRGRA